MPRTALTETAAAVNASTTPTANAVDPTNGHSVSVGKSRKLVFRIDSTFAGAKTFTFVAGTAGPAIKRSQGDLVITLNAAKGVVVVDAARFVQTDGKIYINVAAAATGTIEVYRVPDTV